jgi:hypothetical protein
MGPLWSAMVDSARGLVIASHRDQGVTSPAERRLGCRQALRLTGSIVMTRHRPMKPARTLLARLTSTA